MSYATSQRVYDAIETQCASVFSPSARTLAVAGIPGEGPPSLERLRRLVQNPETDADTRDAVWRELVRQVRSDAADWQLAAIWMMLPGLRSASWKIFRRTGIELKEVDSAVVAGFIEALLLVDPQRPHLGAHLWWKAYNLASRSCAALAREIPVGDVELVTDHRRRETEDDPLAHAVHAGVITGTEAELIDRTRIEGERLGAIAERMGLRYHACQQRRARAEGRLAGYLRIDGASTEDHHRPRGSKADAA